MILKVGNGVSEIILLLMYYRFRNRTVLTAHTHARTHTQTTHTTEHISLCL